MEKGRGRTCCNHGLMELIKWPLILIKILYVFRPGKLRSLSQADVFHRLGMHTAAWVSQALRASSKHCTGSFQTSSSQASCVQVRIQTGPYCTGQDMGPKLWASGVYSRPRWSEEEDERVLAVASAVALGRSGGAHIVGRGVVARRRQAVKGPMECERGHECSGECYRAGGLGTDGSIKRRMGIERTRGWMGSRSPWCRFRQVKDAERKWRYSWRPDADAWAPCTSDL